MEEIIKIINGLSVDELQQLMQVIQERYAAAFPEWDVVFVSIHKDPKLREREFGELMDALKRDLQWHRSQSLPLGDGGCPKGRRMREEQEV